MIDTIEYRVAALEPGGFRRGLYKRLEKSDMYRRYTLG
jgi:hypothetical protein